MSEPASRVARMSAAAHRAMDRLFVFARAAGPATFVGAALFAYFTQSMARYVDVYAAYGAAIAFTMALVVVSVAYTLERDVFGVVVGLIGLFAGLYLLNEVVENAAKQASINDQRCLRIEIEMLSATPRRSDLPEVFAALGCRPQSHHLLQLPKQGRTST